MVSRAKLLSKLLVAALLILSSPQPTEKKFKHRHFAPVVERALAAENRGVTILGLSSPISSSKRNQRVEPLVGARRQNISREEQGQVAGIKLLVDSPPLAARDAFGKTGENETAAKGESFSMNGKSFA
jgi:hypothetical protein